VPLMGLPCTSFSITGAASASTMESVASAKPGGRLGASYSVLWCWMTQLLMVEVPPVCPVLTSSR
jgi:hypothetical protein